VNERFGLVLVGRNEPVSSETRSVRRVTDPLRERAHAAWRERWPDRYEDWSRWNVQALIGPFGNWTYVDFLTYAGLGSTATPHLVHQLRYVPLIDHIDPVDVDPFNPPVLHHSWKVLPESGQAETRGWVERLRRLEIQLGGLLDHPDAQTVQGFKKLLARRGLELREVGWGQFRLLPVGSDPLSVSARP